MVKAACLVGVVLTAVAAGRLEAQEGAKKTAPPAVGTKAPDFTLESLAGEQVMLSNIAKQGPVVLVVLRGYPGYQCPVCSQQVGSLLSEAQKLEQSGAQVLLIYPGPPDQLKKRAEEFLGNKDLPKFFHMLLDPDYTFTNAYALRWDAKNETAYPSTFVLDRGLTVKYAKVSKTHGDRAKTADVLDSLAK